MHVTYCYQFNLYTHVCQTDHDFRLKTSSPITVLPPMKSVCKKRQILELEK